MSQHPNSQKSSASQHGQWASDDDAEDLLAGILSETEDLAEQEKQQLEEELRAREERERQEKEEEERRKREQAEARIRAELERLQQIEQRRTDKLQAIKQQQELLALQQAQAELEAQAKENSVSQDADVLDDITESIPAVATTEDDDDVTLNASATAEVASTTELPAFVPKRKLPSKVLVLGGLAIIALAVVAGLITFALRSSPSAYSIDHTPYAKVVYKPKQVAEQFVNVEFRAIPVAEPPPAAPPARRAQPARSSRRTPAAAPAKRSSRTASPPSRPAPQRQQQPKKKSIDLDLNFDPFGSGM